MSDGRYDMVDSENVGQPEGRNKERNEEGFQALAGRKTGAVAPSGYEQRSNVDSTEMVYGSKRYVRGADGRTEGGRNGGRLAGDRRADTGQPVGTLDADMPRYSYESREAVVGEARENRHEASTPKMGEKRRREELNGGANANVGEKQYVRGEDERNARKKNRVEKESSELEQDEGDAEEKENAACERSDTQTGSERTVKPATSEPGERQTGLGVDEGRLGAWTVFKTELDRLQRGERRSDTCHAEKLREEIWRCLEESEQKRKGLEGKLEGCLLRIAKLEGDAREVASAYDRLRTEHRQLLAELGSTERNGARHKSQSRVGDEGSQCALCGQVVGADAEQKAGVESKREQGEGEGTAANRYEGIARRLNGDGNLAYFDPDAPPYEQSTFVCRSLEEEVKEKGEDSRGLREWVPAVDFELPKHYVWTVESLGLPIPLGRYSQPCFKGSSWEGFNPLRLWQRVGSEERVMKGEEFWVRLAIDAARLPFEYRSNAQRIVVSEAHRVQPRGWTRSILPVDGEVAEVDVWHQCANNALYMPLAVRRQYSYCARSDTLYREWDAADLGIYVVLRACGPENESKKDKREKKEKQGWGRGGERPGEKKSLAAQWTTLVREAVMWGAEQQLSWTAPAHSGPRRYVGDGSVTSIFRHLLVCGFAKERMLVGGDVHGYMIRTKTVEERLLEVKDAVESDTRQRGTALEPKVVMARAKCLLEMSAARIPAERPIVRCRVKEGDPIGCAVREELARARMVE